MPRHTIQTTDFPDFRPTTVIASDSATGRRLILVTALPELQSTLVLEVQGELIDTYDNLDDAIEAYNNNGEGA